MIESCVLSVTGMKCGGCENNVKEKLQAIDGVSAVNASFKDKRVTVEFDSAKIDVDDLIDVIIDAGFAVDE